MNGMIYSTNHATILSGTPHWLTFGPWSMPLQAHCSYSVVADRLRAFFYLAHRVQRRLCSIIGVIGMKKPEHHGFKDLEGMRFTRWTVLTYFGKKSGRTAWICRCDCGTEKSVTGHELRNGDSKSCGCYRRDMTIKAITTHGASHSGKRNSEYMSWMGMRHRCANRNLPNFHRYGGRGITVCTRWLDSFENFLADMGPKPSPEHSIDRIDNDGNYEPGNCRWATRTQQNRNSIACKLTPSLVREIRRLMSQGVKQIDIATQYGLSRGTVMNVCNRTAWGDVK